MNQKNFGKRVRRVREILGLMQKDMAKKLGIAAGSMSEIESGKYKPGHDFFYAISKTFSVNLYYLIFGEGEMFLSRGQNEYIIPENKHEEKLVYYFNRSSVVKFAIMAHFSKTIMEMKDIIDSELKEFEEPNESTT